MDTPGNSPEVKVSFDTVRIYFAGVLHVCVNRAKLVAVQSWKNGTSYFAIEYSFEEGAVCLTEYDREEPWRAILKELDTRGVL